MIKERKFQVHPNVLSSLMHLRLRQELDSMRDGKNAKGKARGRFSGKGKGKGPEQEVKFKSEVRKKWQTKNQRKREKEMKEVEKEQAEAEAEVDREERAQIVSGRTRRELDEKLIPANRDLEEHFRPVLFDPEASWSNAVVTDGIRRCHSVCPFHQRRLFPRSIGSVTTYHL